MNNGNPISVRIRAKLLALCSDLRIKARLLVLCSDFVITGFRTQHWIDLMLLAALFLVGAAIWRDARCSPPPTPLVAGQGGLPPFHVIQLADLRLQGQGDTPPTAERAAGALGRYAFQFVPAGGVIDPGKLSHGDRLSNQLDGRILVGLKVRATNLFTGMNPPFTASLTAAPAERGTTTLLERDLIVLDLQTQGDGLAAVLAVPSADQPTLAAFIGRSDLLLVADRR